MTLLSNVKFYVENFFKFCGLLRISKLYLNHHLMANIWEKDILILVGYLNSGLSYLITTVPIHRNWNQNKQPVKKLSKPEMNYLRACADWQHFHAVYRDLLEPQDHPHQERTIYSLKSQLKIKLLLINPFTVMYYQCHDGISIFSSF